MCVILLALKQNKKYPFIVAANRDEYYDRPSIAADYWPDLPEVIAGRDKLAGGTWLGINRTGRFAAVTNHYEPGFHNSELQSRGELVSSFLVTGESLDEYSRQLERNGEDYNGFGLIFGSFSRLRYQTNRDSAIVDITDGVHGLSNHFLNTPWPRVEEGKRRLLEAAQSNNSLDANHLFDILCDDPNSGNIHSEENSSELIQTTDPSELPIFIRLKDYGTRSSSVVLIDHNGTVIFEERTFDPASNRIEARRRFEFEIQ